MQFAELIGVSEKVVSNWVTGRCRPTLQRCGLVAVALGLDECLVREKAGKSGPSKNFKVVSIPPVVGKKVAPLPSEPKPQVTVTDAMYALFDIQDELKQHIDLEDRIGTSLRRQGELLGEDGMNWSARSECDTRLRTLILALRIVEEKVDHLSQVA